MTVKNQMITIHNGYAHITKIVNSLLLDIFTQIVNYIKLGILSTIYTDEIMSYRFCSVTRINHKIAC